MNSVDEIEYLVIPRPALATSTCAVAQIQK